MYIKIKSVIMNNFWYFKLGIKWKDFNKRL